MSKIVPILSKLKLNLTHVNALCACVSVVDSYLARSLYVLLGSVNMLHVAVVLSIIITSSSSFSSNIISVWEDVVTQIQILSTLNLLDAVLEFVSSPCS